MKAIERTEGDRGSDGKGEGRALGRFLEMENMLEQGLKGGHGCRGYISVSNGNVHSWWTASDVADRSA